jgi:hypothetical protein
MNKSKVMLLATYAISILLIIGVILFFSILNNKIENDLARSSKVIGSPEFTKKFIEKVKSEQFSNADYVELFNANFEAENAGYAAQKALIELNSSFKEIIVLLLVLQLLFLTLYIRQSKKT